MSAIQISKYDVNNQQQQQQLWKCGEVTCCLFTSQEQFIVGCDNGIVHCFETRKLSRYNNLNNFCMHACMRIYNTFYRTLNEKLFVS